MSDVQFNDRQEIERRDFPIVRRGYDPASVDAHLRALAATVDELEREASSRGQESLASVAGTQVQGILEAAQTSAAEIERAAAEEAGRVREEANADALRAREEAIARAQAHVAAVAQSAEALLARVGTMDNETSTLIESLRSGASRLAGDLAAVENEMGELYDAAAGRAVGPPDAGRAAVPADVGHAATPSDAAHQAFAQGPIQPNISPEVVQESFAAAALPAEPVEPRHNGESHTPAVPPLPSAAYSDEEVVFAEEVVASELPLAGTAPTQDDLDGARLVALNMALNGDSREKTGQYLAENFDLSDRDQLLDEVYAAIEG